jgi:hypothetical protein
VPRQGVALSLLSRAAPRRADEISHARGQNSGRMGGMEPSRAHRAQQRGRQRVLEDRRDL